LWCGLGSLVLQPGHPAAPQLPAEGFGFVPAGTLLNVSVSDQSRSDSILVSWDEPEAGAQRYWLSLSLPGSGAPLQNGSAGPNITSFWFHGLTPGTRYEVGVTATLACMETTSQTVTAQTSPSPVRNLSLSSGGSPALLLASWAHGHGHRDGYHLALYHSDSQTLVRNASISPNASTFLFDGLLPGSEYALKVSTLAGSNQASTSIHHWTGRELQVHLPRGKSTSLMASWMGAVGAAWLHLTLHNLPTPTVTTTLSARRGLTSYTFQHLQPGTQYWLGLSVTAGPYTVPGPNATAWTCECDALDTSLQASWRAAPTGSTGYTGTLRESRSQERVRSMELGKEWTNVTFEDLVPGRQYTLEMAAMAGPYRSSVRSATDWTCEPQELRVSWLEPGGGGRDHLVQLSVAESLSIIRNVSVPRGVTQLDLDGLVPGSRYRVEIISQAGPHRTSSQTAVGYTGRNAALLHPSLVPSRALSWWEPRAGTPPGQRDGYQLSVHKEGSSAAARNLEAGKDSTNVTLEQLEPGTCYLVRIWAVAGPYHSPTKNPPWVILGGRHPDRLSASWGAAAGGRDGYALSLYRAGLGTAAASASLGRDTHSFTFTGLAPGYEYSLEASTTAGPYRAAAPNVTGWTRPLPPAAVRLLSTGHPDRLSASWGAAAGGRDGYALSLYRAGLGTAAASASLGRDTHSFTFTGLAPGSKHVLEVASVAGSYLTPAGNVSNWTPLELLTSCMRLSLPQQAGLNSCSGKGQGMARTAAGNTLPWRHVLHRGQVQHLLQGLIPGRNYSVSLSCVAGPYWSSTKPLPVSCCISFTEPIPVEDVQCLPESRSLYLNWSSSPGDVEAYEVVTERLSDGPPTSKYVMSIPTSKASLEGLEPNSSYRILVSTVGMNAMRSQAVTLFCNTTLEALPPPLRADIFRVEASSTVIIPSDLFSEENGQIEYYGVVATTNDSLLRPTQEIMSSTWYDHYYGTEDSYLAVLIPNPFHPRPGSTPETWRVPVGTDECGRSRVPASLLRGRVLTQCSVGPASLGNDVGYKPSLCVCIQVLQVSRLGCLIGHLAGLPDLPIAKGCFPLDFISCRNIQRPIPIQNFKQYYEMKTASANHAFFQEFEELKEVGKEQPKVEAELPANVSKNRYPHVLPYDHSRVKLSQLGEDPHSDYINANFMPGYTSQQEFIATQGPLKKTIEDFWRLVWEQNVCNIIMLTVCMENGRVLCDHYWPSESAPVSYGQVRIHLLMQSSSEEWTTRKFKLWHGVRAERHVSHLHYTAWPDHGIPESTTSIMTFRELVREHIQSTKDAGPTLVHCSAGVGRTGTFIALDRLLQQMKQEKVVDTFGTVYALRMNRYQMIQTLTQPGCCCLCSTSPLHPVSHPRSCPIPLKSFAQHYAQKAAKSHMGFLREYEVRAVLSRVAIGQDEGSILSGSHAPVPTCLAASLSMASHPHASCAAQRWSHCSPPKASACAAMPSPLGGVSQMGTLISLDCLLHQMRADRTVDIYGVTLQVSRSCCLMTPTLHCLTNCLTN
uniref:protein-tyrosine-phosphatase n=1 Tax=Melopsittacus undulatus TaxID=13146 RepID=A0A8C6JHI7_MELUD